MGEAAHRAATAGALSAFFAHGEFSLVSLQISSTSKCCVQSRSHGGAGAGGAGAIRPFADVKRELC